jgi:hypothetical protein
LNSDRGQYGLKHIAAGLANTALIGSCGAAIPVPPNDLDIGPIPMSISPLTAYAEGDKMRIKIIINPFNKKIFFIELLFSNLRIKKYAIKIFLNCQ